MDRSDDRAADASDAVLEGDPILKIAGLAGAIRDGAVALNPDWKAIAADAELLRDTCAAHDASRKPAS